MNSPASVFIFALALGLALISCTSGPAGGPHPMALSVTDESKVAREYVSAGEYRKALNIYARGYDKNPDVYRKSFTAAAENVRRNADDHFHRKNFAEAGTLYRLLLESGVTRRDASAQLSFNHDYLMSQIRLCSKMLLEMGLIKYREASLDEAIVNWKKALVFDPSNKAVLKAIEVATRQIKKLETLND